MDAVTGLREVARRMRELGHEVEFVPGWESRGAGKLTPRGAVNHHTAGSLSGGTAASLRVVTFGRPGLVNALCNTYSDRNGKLYVVAAGVAWHAGVGGWLSLAGNSTVLGHEAENDGVGEPWDPFHLEMLADLDRVQCAVFGFGPPNVCEHKEWTSRKIDRTGIDGPAWRRRISEAAPPVLGGHLMYVCKKGDKGDAVSLLQETLVDLGQTLKVDGDYGDATATAVAKELNARNGNYVNPKRCRRLENKLTVHLVKSQIAGHVTRAHKDGEGKHSHAVTVELV